MLLFILSCKVRSYFGIPSWQADTLLKSLRYLGGTSSLWACSDPAVEMKTKDFGKRNQTSLSLTTAVMKRFRSEDCNRPDQPLAGPITLIYFLFNIAAHHAFSLDCCWDIVALTTKFACRVVDYHFPASGCRLFIAKHKGWFALILILNSCSGLQTYWYSLGAPAFGNFFCEKFLSRVFTSRAERSARASLRI